MEFKNDSLVSHWGIRAALVVVLWHASAGLFSSPASLRLNSSIVLGQEPVFTGHSDTIKSGLDQSITSARGSLRADQLPDPVITKLELQASLSRLHGFLSSANDNRSEGWLNFLRWEELQQELSKEAPQPEVLVQIERNMRQNYRGLEMRIFSEVRLRLREYIHAVRFGMQPNETLQSLEKRFDKLAVAVGSDATGSDLERQREIGFVLSLLDQTGQSKDLVQAVRSTFSRPNVRVLVSEEFIHRQFSRPVSQVNPVNENILGTQICGTGYLSGTVTPCLIQNSHQAALSLLLSASFSSRNVGTNRGVRLQTRGNANIDAAESLSLTDNGLVTNNDTTVNASLSSDIMSIEHRSRIVRKIASRKADDQKPLAESIGRAKLAKKVQVQFHEQLMEQVSEANSRILTPERPIFGRLGLEKPQRTSWSTNDFLSILWRQQGPAQLAAPSSCPLVVPTQGLAIQVHQSSIINLLDPIISGRILQSADLDDLASQFGMEPSQALREEAGGEPWAITMAGFHPVEVEFDNQLVVFRIRTTKLDRGDAGLDQSASVEASYKPVVENGTIQMLRVGDVKIEFVGKAQSGLRAVTLRSFLKKKFDSVFKEVLFDKPLRPTDRLPPNLLMQLVDVQVDDGWLQASLK